MHSHTTIDFPHYTPDVPGYAGPLTLQVRVDGLRLLAGDRPPQSHELTLPPIASVHDFTERDAQRLFDAFDDDDRVVGATTVDAIELDRAKRIVLKDGREAAVLLGGECGVAGFYDLTNGGKLSPWIQFG